MEGTFGLEMTEWMEVKQSKRKKLTAVGFLLRSGRRHSAVFYLLVLISQFCSALVS